MKIDENNLSGDSSLDFIKISFELKNSKLYKEAIEMLYKALSCSDVGDGKCEIISQIAYLYFCLKNYDRAIEQYEKVLDIESTHRSSLFGLCDVYFALKDYDKALNYIKKLCLASPEIENYIFYFKILFELKKYTEIIEIWAKLPPEFKTDTELLYILSKSDNENKKNILENIISIKPNNINAKLDLAVACYNSSDFNYSKKLLEDVLSFGENDKAYFYLGLTLYNLGLYSDSLNAFLSAIKLNPLNSEYFFELSKVYVEQFWYTEALVTCKKSIELNENEENLSSKKLFLAWLNYKLANYDQAKLILDDISSEDRLFKDAQIFKNVILYTEGDIVSSKLNLEIIMRSDPTSTIIYSTLGKIYKDMQYTKKAIETFEKGLRISPNSIEFLSELADLYIDDNNLEAAESILNGLYEKNPNIVSVFNSRARIFYKKKNYEAAKCELLKYLSLEKNNAEIYYFLGLILNDVNMPDIAMQYLKDALLLSPKVAKYYSQLSRSYELKEDFTSALSIAKEACIVCPSDPLFFQRALDLAKKMNSKEDIISFSQKIRYFRV